MDAIKLSPELYANLLDAERRLTSVLTEMDKAEECGIDCQTKREVHRRQMEAIQAIKKNFAP